VGEFKLNKLLNNGALAQLARVLDWQSRGHRFDSDMLHKLQIQAIENEYLNGVRFSFLPIIKIDYPVTF
jgi:hypothetical protein